MIESAEEFVRLRTSRDRDEQRRAAHEPAEITTWLDVVERYPALRTWVALNKTIPLEVLRVLAQDPESTVRSTVAMKRKLDDELFAALATDPAPEVRQQLAHNAKCPPAVLIVLREDESPSVRAAASRSDPPMGSPP